ncbi:hypothetical protein [Pseudomonas sp. D1-2]|uniref:hypothetical protein n=1 Tax=unclassified Pseudomonas TaxID=196821 RepID=UPI003DA9496F
MSKFTLLGTAPDLLDLSESGDDFAYPTGVLSDLDTYLGLEILAMYEYRINGLSEGCIGVYFDFGECGISVVERDGCMVVIEGVQWCSEDNVSLYKMHN